LLPVRISVCGSWIVTSATPGLPMITVAAGALILRMRAMLTLTLIGSAESATAASGEAARSTARATALSERELNIMGPETDTLMVNAVSAGMVNTLQMTDKTFGKLMSSIRHIKPRWGSLQFDRSS